MMKRIFFCILFLLMCLVVSNAQSSIARQIYYRNTLPSSCNDDIAQIIALTSTTPTEYYFCEDSEYRRYGPSLRGVDASKPAASDQNRGTLYFSTDINGGTLYRSDGTTWHKIALGLTETPSLAGIDADDISAPLQCQDVGLTDAYACSLSPAILSYTIGTLYRVKANTANTGAASVNLNTIGAITIKKAEGGITTDLADNDIRAGQWIDMVYDGTNMQMQSNFGNASAGGGGSTNPTSLVIPYNNAGTFADSPWIRFDANTMEQRNGTTTQRFDIFQTWTSSTNNAGLRLGFSGSGGEVMVGSFQGSGGGTAGALRVQGASITFWTGTASPALQWELTSTNLQPSNDNTEILGGEGKRISNVYMGTGGIRFFDEVTNTESPKLRRVSGSIELWDNDDSNFTFFKDAGRLRVSSQFDKTNTTLATVTDLTSQNLKAATAYSFEATLYFDADTVGGHKYAITASGTVTSIIYDIQTMCNASSTYVITTRHTAINGTSGQASCTAGTTTIKGMIVRNNAGTISVQFAQNAASGTSSILVGSILRVEKF
jgi:hypothetical protein